MQQQILAKHPEADLRVYTVWLAMLPQDRRSRWDGGLMPDGRVTHLWDTERAVSRWFAQQDEHNDGFVWDIYLLYSPDARWEATLDPPLGSGRTVRAKRRQLAAQMEPLLSQ